MGSSAVKFRGKGFWCHDSALEFWLRLLIDEVDRTISVEPWLRKLRDHWDEQSRIGGVGIISVGLDDQMTSEQIDRLTRVSQNALKTLWSFGEMIPLDFLNQTCPPGSYYTSEVPTHVYAQVGEYFQALLNGTLVVDTTYGIYGRTIPY